MSDRQASPEASQGSSSAIVSPPTTVGGILRRLGPGLIIAGSIVGSGELIATTATGAQAGFWLLWLILVGCVIKVFVQVELGRYSIVSGQTTMAGMNDVPGPAIAISATGRRGSPSLRGNWLVFYYASVFAVSIGQLGGIVGGVGQALAISAPLTEAGRRFNEQLEIETRYRVAAAEHRDAIQRVAAGDRESAGRAERLSSDVQRMGAQIVQARCAVGREQIGRAVRRAGGDEASLKQVRLLQEAAALVEARAARYGDQPEKVFAADEEDAGDRSLELRAAVEQFGRRTARDHQIWAAVIAVGTAVLLVVGRYGLIQTIATALVASFTLITIINLFALQTNATYAVSFQDLWNGMSCRLTPKGEAMGLSPLATALAAFGIIGVGGNELIAYPYWCLEKGYARFIGPRDDSPEWGERARGWLRVMRWDAWCSMVVYTFATIAFYLLGAAILHKIRLTPQGTEMIRTLAVMYEPVFGVWAQILFLFGAFAVLYSTFFVANAGHARVIADGFRVLGIGSRRESSYRRLVVWFSGLFPLLCLVVYLLLPKPTMLILASGVMQAILLPMLSGAALFFRYKRIDPRVVPGKLWDALLWISALGMLVAGGWLALTVLFPALKQFG